MKNKYLLSLIFYLSSIICATAAVPASVTRAVRQVKAAPALEVACTVNGHAASMEMSGECFHINLGNAEVYYDGSTQWSYSPLDKEVTIFTPTTEEVAESNPLNLLQNLDRDYNCEVVKGDANTVRLTPRQPSGPIAEATITFNPTTGWPTHITLIMGGRRADLTNLRFTAEKAKRPVGAFQFNPPKGVTVTDLR